MKDFSYNINNRTYYLVIGQAEDIDGETINIVFHNHQGFEPPFWTALGDDEPWPSPAYDREFSDRLEKSQAEFTAKFYNLNPPRANFFKNGRNFRVYEIVQSIATETYGQLAT